MASTIWIPAFAGMTKIKTYPCKPIKGEGICRSRFVHDLEVANLASILWVPAFAGMTKIKTYPC